MVCPFSLSRYNDDRLTRQEGYRGDCMVSEWRTHTVLANEWYLGPCTCRFSFTNFVTHCYELHDQACLET